MTQKIIAGLYSILSLGMFYTAYIVNDVIFNNSQTVISAGLKIKDIRSVGGTTLEEAYYSKLGDIYVSTAGIFSGLRIFFVAILIFIGVICIIKALKLFDDFKSESMMDKK